MLVTELITEDWKKNTATLTMQNNKGCDGGTGETLGGAVQSKRFSPRIKHLERFGERQSLKQEFFFFFWYFFPDIQEEYRITVES